MRFRVEIGDDGAAAAAGFLERWCALPALRRLVEADGGAWPESDGLVARLELLHAFSERWDFRRGGERLEISGAATAIDEDTIRAAAADLGMAVPEPTLADRYDHAIVLGGTALASYYRTRLLADLSETVTFGSIGVLGALRQVSEQEHALVAGQADMAGVVGEVPATEFEVLVGAATTFLPPIGPVSEQRSDDENPNLSTASASYDRRDGRLVVLAAASPAPGRRASTLDNYHSYARSIGAGQSVLIVTSTIYTPYQFFSAIRALGWSKPVTIEMTSFPPAWMSGILTAPHNYLQETRSAIFGALALARDIEAAATVS